MQVYWQPHPGPQTRALMRPEFEVLYGGARGGGKTDAGQAWLSRWVHNPRYRFLVIRRNHQDLSDWIDRAKIFYAPVGMKLRGNPPELIFPGGATGRTGHLKDQNAYDHYQGHEYQRMLIEELTQIARQELYEKLLMSCRSTVPEIKPQVFCTTNPGGPGHVWVKKRFEISRGSERKIITPEGMSRIFIPARLSDNPTLSLGDPSYEARLRALPEKLRKAWLEGSWDVFDGQFFDSFDTDTHVCAPFDIPKDWARFIGIDYGYAAPSVVLWFASSPDGGTYQYRELYQPGLTFERLKEEILRRSEGETITKAFIDPAMKGSSQGTGIRGWEVLNEGQHKIQFHLADNDRVNGWARLREYYRVRQDAEGRPYAWLKIFDTCSETIRSVPELVHDSNRVEDVDTDGDDHCADAQRYFVMGRPVPAYVPPPDIYKDLDPRSKTFWKEHFGQEGSPTKDIRSMLI